ncbi:unnamed protein product (macronuclear) [Paramecium tetraurelia]|uniref:Uncharacterized protein n=1 Tax=Paramecium tetraurelia TaxID=5888 RepID=A0BFK2_PARTE|nr:uncharacterized protein GSPATT00028354001 [Paramecium tetraurelia]CAK57319.1 unnamed protein product [Paramecium tetraurelia]|eukprot:XP_001424717.1 hypothetical protein (macronuclear) [Paramecium tetraurelia strain d4-2]
MKQNQEYEAYLKYKEIIFLDSKHQQALCRIGSYLFKCNKYNEAQEYFSKCLCINQNNYEALLGYGKVDLYLKLTLQDYRINQYWQIIIMKERLILIHWIIKCFMEEVYKRISCQKGVCLKSLNDFENSQKMFKKALMLNQSHFESLFSLADYLRQVDKYIEAIAYFDQALQIKPQHPELWEGKGYQIIIKLAFCLRELNDNEEAVNCYEKALKYDPTSYEALKGMGLSLRKLYKCDESIVFFEKALQIQPNNVFSLKGKGLKLQYQQLNAQDCRENGKRPQSIIHGFCIFILVNTGLCFSNVQLNLKVISLAQMESIVTTLRQHENDIILNPQNTNPIFGKAECLRMLNDFDGALQFYMKTLQIDPNHINSLIGYGFCLGYQNKFQLALEQYDKALTLNKYSTDALWGKGECLRMLMDFNNALVYYEKVLILYPCHYISLSGKGKKCVKLGDCLRMLGLYQQALDVYKQALFIQSNQPSLLYGKAVCLIAQNNFETAPDLLRQAKKVAPPNFFVDKAICIINFTSFRIL